VPSAADSLNRALLVAGHGALGASLDRRRAAERIRVLPGLEAAESTHRSHPAYTYPLNAHRVPSRVGATDFDDEEPS
jgi:hypothetical protein